MSLTIEDIAALVDNVSLSPYSCGEEEPPCHNQEDGDDDVGNGGNEIGAEFLLEDVRNLTHVSSPESVSERYFPVTGSPDKTQEGPNPFA